MRDLKCKKNARVRETSYDIDAEARRNWSMNLKIVLDSKECLTDQFISAEKRGEVITDSLGFLWYPMTQDEIDARAHALTSLAQVIGR